ncbi:MAG: DMT family transporter [Alphaproteobacteria bacterium]|jgi:drug/metabolite transporter (DMT)-like permease|nr:DMT family transporter [Alphaproteobacteria bacterium]
MALNSAGDSARISGLKAKERRPLRFEPRVGALSLTLMLASGIVGPLRFVLNKIAVEGGVPPFAFAFWPMLFAGILLLIVAFLRGDRPSLKFSHLRAYLSVGIFALGAPMAVLTFLADRLPQGLISMVVILAPTMTYLFAILLRVDRLRLLSSAGMAVGLGGILLIVLPDVSLPERAMVWWLLLALLAPVLLGLGNVLTALLRPPMMAPTVLGAGMLLSAAALLAPIMALSGQFYLFDGAAPGVDWNFLYATLLNAAFYVAFLEVIRLSGPVFFSQINYLAVAAGFGWGMILFGERYSLYVWGGTALMAISVLLLTLGARAGSRAER